MQNIRDVLKSGKYHFPIVVRSTCDLFDNVFPCKDMGNDVEMSLDKPILIPYAHVRILPVADERKTMSEHGGDWILVYNGFVGEELLIPLRYPGKLKIIPHPHRRPRYTSVSQIIENPPPYMIMEEDIEYKDATGNRVRIPGRTRLEIKAVTSTKSDYINMNFVDCLYLECENENGVAYLLNEHTRVNCTGVYTQQLYTLTELVNSMLLPKVIQFKDVPRSDIIEFDVDRIDGLLTMSEGCIEVLGVNQLEVIVGWTPSEFENTAKKAIIPKEMWDKIPIKVTEFKSKHEQLTYINTQFGKCDVSVLEDDKLYFVAARSTDVTWLKNTQCHKTSLLSKKNNTPSSIQQSTAPPPPIPERMTKSKKAGKDVASKTTEKIKVCTDKPGFHQIHRDLNKLFQKPTHTSHNLLRVEETEEVPKHDESTKVISKPGAENVRQMKTPSISTYGRSQSKVGVTHSITHEVKTTLHDRKVKEMDPPTEDKDRYDYPIFEDITRNHITEKDLARIVSRNQTREDFYQYNVTEVSQCFYMCALKELSNACMQQKVDGAFLEHFELNNLKHEPFCLSDFEVTKVRAIINDGWRPKE